MEYCVMIIYTKTKIDTPDTIEGENLAAHVVLCQQRDAANKNRITTLSDRMDRSEERENELRSYILKTLTTAVFSLLSSVVSLGIMLSQFIKN
jgi:hypothetical protein